MNISKSDYQLVLEKKKDLNIKQLRNLLFFFEKQISLEDLLNNKELNTKDLKANSRIEKIRYLSSYLNEEKGITLERAIVTSPLKIENILNGSHIPSSHFTSRIADYFYLANKTLTDKNIELPMKDDLLVDEDLLRIQKDDLETKLILFKNKHYIKRNYKALSHPKRFKLIMSMILIMAPLLGYTAYCAYSASVEKANTVDSYIKGSDETYIYNQYDEKQVKYHEDLQKTSYEAYKNGSLKDEPYYCEVKVGAELEKIKNISSATSSYETRMQLFFIFNKADFKRMFYSYSSSVLWDKVMNDYYASCDPAELLDERNLTFTEFLSNAKYGDQHNIYYHNWVTINDEKYYPGETPTNTLTEKETMFDIGNGEFVPDSYGTIKGLEEVVVDGVTYCYQKVKFNAKFEKAFTSVRYPLDSVEFDMRILPIMDAEYIRYVPNRDVNTEGNEISHFSPYFGITNGYRLVENKENISNLTLRLNYFVDTNNDPAVKYENTYRTELQIAVRANREGISLFLQAFVNLFSVVIWITIAFYNQSHNGEDSIGMLGTGLFGVISSMLIGLSMVSDAGIFSLITMINIFTLAVIMIMTYQSIAAKRAQVKKDIATIAYNGVKLRIMFYLLSICIAMMFIGLPLLSYIFGL